MFLFLAPLDRMPLFIGVTSCLWGLLLLLMKIYFWPCDQLTGVGKVFLSPPRRLVKYWLLLCWCLLFVVSLTVPSPFHPVIHPCSVVIKVWSFSFDFDVGVAHEWCCAWGDGRYDPACRGTVAVVFTVGQNIWSIAILTNEWPSWPLLSAYSDKS